MEHLNESSLADPIIEGIRPNQLPWSEVNGVPNRRIPTTMEVIETRNDMGFCLRIKKRRIKKSICSSN